jgi:hypothetical protein
MAQTSTLFVGVTSDPAHWLSLASQTRSMWFVEYVRAAVDVSHILMRLSIINTLGQLSVDAF